MIPDPLKATDELYQKAVRNAQRQLNVANDAAERRALAAPIFVALIRDESATALCASQLGLSSQLIGLARMMLPNEDTEHLTGRVRQLVALTALLTADDLLTAAAALEALPEQADA